MPASGGPYVLFSLHLVLSFLHLHVQFPHPKHGPGSFHLPSSASSSRKPFLISQLKPLSLNSHDALSTPLLSAFFSLLDNLPLDT